MTDYRDVTPNQNSNSNQNIKEVIGYILAYLRHPIHKIKTLPDWTWTTLLLTLIAVSMASGVIAGLVSLTFFRLMGGLIISPLIAIITATLGSLFIYYYFQVFEKRTCSFKKIFSLILFADIPFFIFQTGSELIPPVTLVGFAFTSLLLAVGLTENFSMEKRKSLRLVSVLFGLVFILWLWNRLD